MDPKRFGMSTMSRLKLDQLSDHSYNNEKFKSFF